MYFHTNDATKPGKLSTFKYPYSGLCSTNAVQLHQP